MRHDVITKQALTYIYSIFDASRDPNKAGPCQCLNIGLKVMSDHKARSKRVNDSLKTTHTEAVPNEDIEGGGERFRAVN